MILKMIGAGSVLFSILAMGQSGPEKQTADIIFVNGDIYTGVMARPVRQQAIAVHGERVLAIGATNDVLQLRVTNTVVVDLGGRFVIPGFNDAHMHLINGGFSLLRVNFHGAKSLDEFKDRLRSRVAAAAPGEWVEGEGWDETLWPVKVPPSRADLDEITTDHPVFLQRVDGHIAVVNTPALKLAGITAASPDPAGGKIDRDRNGAPTGILRETARGAVAAVVPKPTHAQKRQAYEEGLRELARWGVTSAQDNSDSGDSGASWDDFMVLEELRREGKLTVRISEWMPFAAPLPELVAHREAALPVNDWLRTGMLKAYMDGSLGSHTAAMLGPYADDPKNSGIPRYVQSDLTRMAKERASAGFQLGFHAIGDGGVEMALNAFEAAEKAANTAKRKSPTADFRFRIEHAQVTTPSQIARFRELHVIASMQPSHLLTDMNWAGDRLGPQRAAHSYAWNEFLRSGVMLVFGTDFPVEPVNPFRGLYSAVTRKSEDGKKEYFPEQKLTMEQAIAAYTAGPAFAEFAEKDKGTLEPGKLADFVVLDRDITKVSPEQVLGTKVLRTVVGGKTVFAAK